MAAPPDNHPGSLTCQTWILRVPIHCEGCKKKVKKILLKIEGVYMTTVDAQQHKVVVTGNIDAETLLKRLAKSGKPAELWAGKGLPDMGTAVAKDGGSQKTKSPEGGSLKTQKSSADKFDIPENGLNPPVLDVGKPPELGKDHQVDGNNSEANAGKKKKKKSKGADGDSAIDKNSIPPPPSSGPGPTPDAPAPTPTPDASAPQPVSAPAPVLADAPAAASGPAGTIAPESAAALPTGLMPAAGTHEPAPGPAPVGLPAMPPMDQSRPMEPNNCRPPTNLGPPNHQGPQYEPCHGPENNFGPPSHQGPQYEPCHGPENNFGPMNQPSYPFQHPQPPPPQLGVSYNMAQPSLSTSYYAPPYYSYGYPQHPMMHAPPPPPPSYPISEAYGDDRYYNDDASQCRLM